ncbi:hypothetical protein T484DRAFT_1820808, partial [Baffinella frigidus]
MSKGEFLYQEGLARKHMQTEQRRLIKDQKHMHAEQRRLSKDQTEQRRLITDQEERHQASQNLFSPQISAASRLLRRDMPVVERLLMLDQ